MQLAFCNATINLICLRDVEIWISHMRFKLMEKVKFVNFLIYRISVMLFHQFHSWSEHLVLPNFHFLFVYQLMEMHAGAEFLLFE